MKPKFFDFVKKEDTGWILLDLKDGITAPYAWKKPMIRRIGNVVEMLGVIKGVTSEWSTILTVPDQFKPKNYDSGEGNATYQYITPCLNDPRKTQCLNLAKSGELNITTVFGRTISENDEIQIDCVYLI